MLPKENASDAEIGVDDGAEEPDHSDWSMFRRIVAVSFLLPCTYGLITALFFVGTPLLMRYPPLSIQFQCIGVLILLLFIAIPFSAFLLGIKASPGRKRLTATILCALVGIPLYGFGVSCPFIPGIDFSPSTATVSLLSLSALVGMITVAAKIPRGKEPSSKDP